MVLAPAARHARNTKREAAPTTMPQITAMPFQPPALQTTAKKSSAAHCWLSHLCPATVNVKRSVVRRWCESSMDPPARTWYARSTAWVRLSHVAAAGIAIASAVQSASSEGRDSAGRRAPPRLPSTAGHLRGRQGTEKTDGSRDRSCAVLIDHPLLMTGEDPDWPRSARHTS